MNSGFSSLFPHAVNAVLAAEALLVGSCFSLDS